MKILVVDCGSSKVPLIPKSIEHIAHPIVQKWNEVSPPNDLNGIIISGAPILLTQTKSEPYTKLSKSLIDLRIPILGICFGHQILGLQFGASIRLIEEDRDWQRIELLRKSNLFEGLVVPIKMMEDHCEVIDLPADFTAIAQSKSGLEAMQHASLPLYGVQFHPESSEKQGQQLLHNFIRICQNHSRLSVDN